MPSPFVSMNVLDVQAVDDRVLVPEVADDHGALTRLSTIIA